MLQFTPRAQQVLKFARQETDRFNHNFVGTEHLLLGLIALGQGLAVQVLVDLGLDLDNLRAEVEKQVGRGPDQNLIGHPPYTPRVKKVLALAAREAGALDHTYVGTEHILLGLLREWDGVAARLFEMHGVNIEQTRKEIMMQLDPDFEPEQYVTESSACTESATSAARPASGEASVAAPISPRPIDVSKRYDIYCCERDQDVVVYRNALFKGSRRLFPENRDHLSDFLELEQADRQTVFVAKYSVFKFCEPGVEPDANALPGKQP